MVQSRQQRYHPRIFLQGLVVVVCCGLAFGVRQIIAADMLDDVPSVALQALTLIALTIGFVASIVVSCRARGVTERAVLPALAAMALFIIAGFAAASFADTSIALHALTASDDGSTVVVLGPGGHDVRLSGELTEGVATRVGALLDAHPSVQRIHLTSEGGLVDEGEALRQVIAKHRLVTFVPDYCVSACTLAFLGGRERLFMEGARLGFHAPYQEGLFGQVFAGDKEMERAAYVAAGAASAFVDKALKVRSADIWVPDDAELIKANVATGVVDHYRFPDSNLDDNPTVAGAREEVIRNFPLAKALESWRPKALDTVAGWYLDAYRNGLSEGEVVDGLRETIGDAAALAVASADDETLLGVGRFLDTALGAAESDEECAAIGERADLVEAETVLDRDEGEADGLAIALLTRALKSRGSAAPTRSTATPIDIALDDGRACSEMRRLYSGMLRKPRHEAVAAIRALASRGERMSPLALAVVNGRS